jgi:Putative auto-transporter adhesin, head GIN domain
MTTLNRLAGMVFAVITIGMAGGVQAQAQLDTSKPAATKIAPNKFALGEFKRLQIDGHMDVVLKQGADSFVEFDGKEFDTREASGLKFETKGDLLSICSCQSWKFWRKEGIKVIVGFKALEELRILGSGSVTASGPIKLNAIRINVVGSGDIIFSNLEAIELKASISGSGDIKLIGTTKELAVSVAGSGDFSGEKFKADIVRVSIAGAGDVKVWANNELSMSIAGAGNIDHWGPAKIMKQSIAGVGSVNAKSER